MLITLTAFLAGAQALPQIDRTALELQARAEALAAPARTTSRARTTPARTTAAPARSRTQTTEPRKPAAEPVRTAAARPQVVRPGPTRQVTPGPARQTQTASAAQRRTQPRRASGGGPLDLASITTICRAAGNQEDPAGFIARLSTAYSLTDADSTSLRASCAAYLAGRADARRNGGGTY